MIHLHFHLNTLHMQLHIILPTRLFKQYNNINHTKTSWISISKTTSSRPQNSQTIPNITGQIALTNNQQPRFTFITIHTTPLSTYSTSITLSRPPLSTIPTNQLTYSRQVLTPLQYLKKVNILFNIPITITIFCK